MRVLLVSTYELGHQPLHLAIPAAALLAAGHDVRCCDVAVEELDASLVDWADRLALSVPMHTAMRLALRVADAARSRRPGLPICFFGLYASSAGAPALPSPGDVRIAGEYLPGLVSWAGGGEPGPVLQLGRAATPLPARHLLPALDRYARLTGVGEERLSAAVEVTRGCSHKCGHCPVPVVYRGRVRSVEDAVVIADVDQLVRAGARHVTFADPDFLNAPARSLRVVAAIHARHPGLTFDCTTKVEHILRHAGLWPDLAAFGCLFVVSAFESANDTILGLLAKGHTVDDASAAVALLRAAGIEIRPSWLPFTPWTTAEDLMALLDFVVAHDLVPNVDPVQYTVRLLVPDGSLLLGSAALAPHLRGYDPDRLGWMWSHPDPNIDALQHQLAALVEARVGHQAQAVFDRIDTVVRSLVPANHPAPNNGALSRGPAGDRPRLTEPWFCCSEPTESQLAPLG